MWCIQDVLGIVMVVVLVYQYTRTKRKNVRLRHRLPLLLEQHVKKQLRLVQHYWLYQKNGKQEGVALSQSVEVGGGVSIVIDDREQVPGMSVAIVVSSDDLDMVSTAETVVETTSRNAYDVAIAQSVESDSFGGFDKVTIANSVLVSNECLVLIYCVHF